MMLALLLLLAAQELSPAQEPESPPSQPTKEQAEIEQLVKEIGERMARAEDALTQARDAVEQEKVGPMIHQLGQAEAQADGVVAAIDRLLEILPQQPQGGDGSDQDNPQTKPKPEQAQPDRPKPDSAESKQEGQEGSAPPDAGVTERLLYDPRGGQWGSLPPRLRSVLENSHADDLPLRYRRWLEDYHRRQR